MPLLESNFPFPKKSGTKAPLRKYPRAKVDLPVEATMQAATFHTRILTLGGGGLLLIIPREAPPDTELAVQFRPAKRLPVIAAKASVRYQLPDQATGIEFTQIRPEDRQVLLQWILHRIGQKRRYPRKRFVTQVEHETGAFLGCSRDLSVGGMFIETTEPLAEGSKLRLRFHVEETGPIVVVTAVVVYAVKDMGVGIQFLDLSQADRGRIDVYVTRGESSA